MDGIILKRGGELEATALQPGSSLGRHLYLLQNRPFFHALQRKTPVRLLRLQLHPAQPCTRSFISRAGQQSRSQPLYLTVFRRREPVKPRNLFATAVLSPANYFLLSRVYHFDIHSLKGGLTLFQLRNLSDMKTVIAGLEEALQQKSRKTEEMGAPPRGAPCKRGKRVPRARPAHRAGSPRERPSSSPARHGPH